jgi:hypothetical protein
MRIKNTKNVLGGKEMGEEGWLKNVLLDSWDIVVAGVAKERKLMLEKGKKWEIKNRTKIKSLAEGLQRFENADDSVLHFVKHAEYYLPRSDFNNTLEILLEKVAGIREGVQEKGKDAKEMKKRIQYLVGYVAWSLDGFENILNLSKSDEEVEERVRNMVNVEFSIVGAGEEKKKEIIEGLMKWKSDAEKSQRRE